PIEVFISLAQFEYWKYTHITIDAVPGRGAGFSVEGPTGMRFIIRSRMLDDAELTAFGLVPELPSS
ncbi:MAG: UDP-glucose 4-epimerase, partial [Microbacterium sp.]|nr:UDP-glucose 4-epimerase [Microbacterium sp.]